MTKPFRFFSFFWIFAANAFFSQKCNSLNLGATARRRPVHTTSRTMSFLVDALSRCTVGSLRSTSTTRVNRVKPTVRVHAARSPPSRHLAAPVKSSARTRVAAKPRGSLLVRRASDPEEDWEVLFANLPPALPVLPAYKTAILERALARGRRQVPIRDLASDLDLSREDVLDWLKANKHRADELSLQYPPENEMVARIEIDPFDPSVRADGRDYDNVVDEKKGNDVTSTKQDDDAQTSYLRNAQTPHVPGGMPAYKGFSKKRLGATNVNTLEKVFAQDRFPDDSMIDAVHRATKLPRSKIVAWFTTKREDEKAMKKREVRGRFSPRKENDDDDDGFGTFDDRPGKERERNGGRREGSGGGWKGGGGDPYGETKSKDKTGGWTGNGRRS
jgi:hypothetical protein